MRCAALPSLALAQEWPGKQPIRIIVPYAPGGPIDVTARQLAERVKDSLGPVIIENRPGAGGNIGADAVAKAAPDGLTLGIAAVATHAINPWLFGKMPYNAATDFAPITQWVRVPNVLVMNADTAARLKINSLADLISTRYGKNFSLAVAVTILCMRHELGLQQAVDRVCEILHAAEGTFLEKCRDMLANNEDLRPILSP